MGSHLPALRPPRLCLLLVGCQVRSGSVSGRSPACRICPTRWGMCWRALRLPTLPSSVSGVWLTLFPMACWRLPAAAGRRSTILSICPRRRVVLAGFTLSFRGSASPLCSSLVLLPVPVSRLSCWRWLLLGMWWLVKLGSGSRISRFAVSSWSRGVRGVAAPPGRRGSPDRSSSRWSPRLIRWFPPAAATFLASLPACRQMSSAAWWVSRSLSAISFPLLLSGGFRPRWRSLSGWRPASGGVRTFRSSRIDCCVFRPARRRGIRRRGSGSFPAVSRTFRRGCSIGSAASLSGQLSLRRWWWDFSPFDRSGFSFDRSGFSPTLPGRCPWLIRRSLRPVFVAACGTG